MHALTHFSCSINRDIHWPVPQTKSRPIPKEAWKTTCHSVPRSSTPLKLQSATKMAMPQRIASHKKPLRTKTKSLSSQHTVVNSTEKSNKQPREAKSKTTTSCSTLQMTNQPHHTMINYQVFSKRQDRSYKSSTMTLLAAISVTKTYLRLPNIPLLCPWRTIHAPPLTCVNHS